ncbi:interactor of HORMAD1 protein 1 isoform X2 [Engystomops pustulosus]
MNLNVWNIKDMFSVPPGAGISKSANRNPAQSEHSSLSDSQFLFSSQFCPDGSQQGSLDYASQTRYQKNSNQNSQDSEPSIYQKYQMKPPLCSDDPNDRNAFHQFGLTKPKDIIDQFEESKKRAREKHDSEHLHQLICNVQGTLQDLKLPFFNIEENINLRCQSILDSIEAVSKAMEEKISAFHESILKVVPLKSDLEQAIINLEKKIQQKDSEVTDLKSNIQLLLTTLQSSEDRVLREIRQSGSFSCSSIDKTTQTSPIVVPDLSLRERVTCECRTMITCPYGPANAPCTCGGISNNFTIQHRGNPGITHGTGSETSTGSGRNNSADQRRQKNVITIDNTVTSARNLQHLCQDESFMPIQQHIEEEHRVIVTRSKGKSYSAKKPKSYKRRKGLKKKTAKMSAQVPSRPDNPRHAPPAITPVTANQDSSTFFSQDCGSSCQAVTPTPLRKTQAKKSLKFSLLRSQQIIERSEIKVASSGDCVRFAKAERELGQCDVTSRDADDPHSDKSREREEDNMVWFPSSSPLHGHSLTYSAQETGEKDLLALFFDTSDDTD